MSCSDEATISDWVILEMGFLQKQGRMNGMVKLFLKVLATLQRDYPQARVEIHPWGVEPDDRAEFILQAKKRNTKLRIVIIGFSYGGYTAKLIADRLKDRGIEVDLVIMLDAVYRHWYALGWWRAFWPWSTIRICDSVRRVIQYRQKNSLPRGHRIVAEDPRKTKIGEIRWVNATHIFVDDQQYIHDECLSEIAKLFGGPAK